MAAPQKDFDVLYKILIIGDSGAALAPSLLSRLLGGNSNL